MTDEMERLQALRRELLTECSALFEKAEHRWCWWRRGTLTVRQMRRVDYLMERVEHVHQDMAMEHRRRMENR